PGHSTGFCTKIVYILSHFWSHVQIDWSEPWLIGLIAVHLLCSLMVFTSRNYVNIQAFLFVGFLGLVFFAENINEKGSEHWRSFSRQQYFDSKGIFISLVFSVPLLLNSLILIILWLYQTIGLLIHVKSAKLKQQMREAQRAKEANAGDGDSAETKKNL
ncbi:PREDICTED: transmembrane protein 18-like, partial [Priapulus caudatus]|uniref:Transmembrane protein 18 n=1 Tax=Priapulus caudatus TaxID=37621 RepID=A0ABM1EFL5_PRICU